MCRAAARPHALCHCCRPPQYTIDDHRLTVPQVAARFATQLDLAAPSRSAGLPAAEAARRLAVYGANVLTPPP